MSEEDKLKKMAEYLAKNPDLLKMAQEMVPAAEKNEPSGFPTTDEWIAAAANAMRNSFEKNAPGLKKNRTATDETQDVPKEEGEGEKKEEEEEEEEEKMSDDEDEEEEEEEKKTPMKQDPKNDEGNEEAKKEKGEFDFYPKGLLEEFKAQKEKLERKTQENERIQKDLQAKLEVQQKKAAEFSKAFALLHQGNGEEAVKHAQALLEKKVIAKQKKMLNAIKYTETILKKQEEKNNNDEGTFSEEDLEKTSAIKQALENMRKAAGEKDIEKANNLLSGAESLRVMATAAAAEIAEANGLRSRLSDMEKKLQADKKSRRTSSTSKRNSQPKSDFPSPSDMAKRKSAQKGKRKRNDDENEEVDPLVAELVTFASSTFKVWSDNPEPKHKKVRKPFCRRDFKKMIPFGESIQPEYALQACDQFSYRKHGCPNYRDVMASLFGGETNVINEVKNLDDVPVIPRPDPSIEGGYTDNQWKSFGLVW